MAGETYALRYGGGFLNSPSTSTPVDAQFLNAVEAALLKLLGEDPAADEVPVWTPGSSRFVFQKITNAHIDAAAAIAQSKLSLSLTNADIAANAAIARSKLAGVGYMVLSSKVTSKTVNTTVTDTDLLNGEFSVSANGMGTTGLARLSAWGDWKQNSGGVAVPPRLKLKLGASPTTVIDTGAGSAHISDSATRTGWRVVVEILNLTAATQVVNFFFTLTTTGDDGTGQDSAFTTGSGRWGGGGTGDTKTIFGNAVNTAAIDTTAAMNVLLTVVNGSANAAYETKLLGSTLEVIS